MSPPRLCHRLCRRLAALACLTLAAACTKSPWDDPIDVSQLVRVAPADLRAQSVIPPGLGETGHAVLRWQISNPDGSTESAESYRMQRTGQATPAAPSGPHQVTYRLSAADLKRFQQQQIRQRAQLLAGFYSLNLGFGPELCDHPLSRAGNDVIFSVLHNGASGQKITTIRLEASAAEIEARSAPCT